jgi:ethanolamine utilization protein EutN
MGNATATVKHPSMEGAKLLLVMALQADGRTIEGDPILVVDKLGAGRGEMVMITSDGIGAREMLGDEKSPVRWTVLGIPDR